ncbi:hypothetical protein [Flavobacterium sp.]|uniref:hypothetical protein n=1 Tax=Flavobacterium sp. TaxID=239 RepID=UPI002601A490|nr:hypothetical protein [Flavobacterium sp.]
MLTSKREQNQRNKHIVSCLRKFGFNDIKTDKLGWVLYPNELLDVEEIEFISKNEKVSQNSIEVGRGLNNVWTYGISYCTGGAGGSGSASIFGETCKTRNEAIIKALQKLIEAHQYQEQRCKGDSLGNYIDSYSQQIRKEVLNILYEITN